MQYSINQRFVTYCNKRGIKQAYLVSAGYASKQTISWIWNGRTKPGCEFLEKFAVDYKDLNLRWLLTGEGEMIPLEDQSASAVITYLEKKVKEKEDLISEMNQELDTLKDKIESLQKSN